MLSEHFKKRFTGAVLILFVSLCTVLSCRYDEPAEQNFEAYLEMRSGDYNNLSRLENGDLLIVLNNGDFTELKRVTADMNEVWSVSLDYPAWLVSTGSLGMIYLGVNYYYTENEQKIHRNSTIILNESNGKFKAELSRSGQVYESESSIVIAGENTAYLYNLAEGRITYTNSYRFGNEGNSRYFDWQPGKDGSWFVLYSDHFSLEVSRFRADLVRLDAGFNELYHEYQYDVQLMDLLSLSFNGGTRHFLSGDSEQNVYLVHYTGIMRFDQELNRQELFFEYPDVLKEKMREGGDPRLSSLVYNTDEDFVVFNGGTAYDRLGNSRFYFPESEMSIPEQELTVDVRGYARQQLYGVDTSGDPVWRVQVPHVALSSRVIQNFIYCGEGIGYALARYRWSPNGYTYRLWQIRVY